MIDYNQAKDPPFDSLSEVLAFTDAIRHEAPWHTVGVLSDEENINVVIVLLSKESSVIAAFRINASPEDISVIMCNLLEVDSVFFRCWQGDSFSDFDTRTVESIDNVWQQAVKQDVSIKTDELTDFFRRLMDNERRAGRGKDFTKLTKETVYRDAHGRCMFTGCGEPLSIDVITGRTGNYSYLAHNVASSEQGTRGIIEASGKLSNEPDNVLLMCDKHHRLIDTVAARDYSAVTLSKMRADFCRSVTRLLDGLKYEAIPAYAALWPVNSQVVAAPSLAEIASCLSVIQKRLFNNINMLSDNEGLLRDSPDILWRYMPALIDKTAKEIIQQTIHNGHHAALFVLGPMPALIGLGALLGNKNHYIPMLMFRDTGRWEWPLEKLTDCYYEMCGLDNLQSGTDFVVTISLTAKVPKLMDKAKELNRKNGAQIIEINALDEVMGNGAIAHPENGKKLCVEFQQLLHKLGSEYGAKKVHLLVCASNAASMFIGQAFDNYHPDVIVYDFSDKGMVPRLLLQNNAFKTTISLPIDD